VPTVRQEGDKDCGAAALSAVLAYWGMSVPPSQILAALHHAPREGVAAGELTAYARARGFDAYVLHGDVSDVTSELSDGRPFIVGVAKSYGDKWLSHYEVVTGYHPPSQSVLTLDPARGWRKNALSGFLGEWNPTGRVVIVVFPSPRAG
jgi:ABC-type bacteriocin/lantibiotic exporter with double-glycine peptidase domain